MSRLGDVLELIHSSRRRFRTARVAGRTDDTVWRLWWAGDDHYRFEYAREGGGHVGVRAGPVWWALDPDGEAHTNDGDPNSRLGMAPEFGLLHTRSLLACAILESLREERVAGRAAVVLRATPRPGAGHWRWWGFWGSADPIEVPIDLERGVALGGFNHRVDAIAFDEEFPTEVFSQPYPRAEDLRRVHRGLELARELPLEEVRRAVGFPVLLPRALPEGARLLRCLVDPEDPPEWVGLSWAIDPGFRFFLHLRQGPALAREATRFRGREVVRGGARLLVEPAGEESIRSHRVLVERRGTWVEVDADLPLDTVIQIALSVGEGEQP
jgi:hypothetical protein